MEKIYLEQIKDLFNEVYSILDYDYRVKNIKRLDDVRVLSSTFNGYYLTYSYSEDSPEDILETRLSGLLEKLEQEITEKFNAKIYWSKNITESHHFYILIGEYTDATQIQRIEKCSVQVTLECLSSFISFIKKIRREEQDV